MSIPQLPTYMDYSATTPVNPRAINKMIPYLRESFGNPTSCNHSSDWEAEKAVEAAREQVAALVNTDPREIAWTSDTTKSDNLAIKGIVNSYSSKSKHIVTVKTEHKVMLGTTRELECQGFEMAYPDVKDSSLIDIDVFGQAIRPDTILVSVMVMNDEVDAIQDIEQFGEICHEKGAIFRVDAAQVMDKVEIDLQKLKAGLMSSSAHKTYGPKGIGALYVRREPRICIEAQIHGGDHEHGMRSGTLTTRQVAGMDEVFHVVREEMVTENERIRMLRGRLYRGLSTMEKVYVNDNVEARVPRNLNISFNFVEDKSLIMAIEDVAVSSGSACTLTSLEPLYMLRMLNRSGELAHSLIRFTVSRFATGEEVDYVVELLKSRIGKLHGLPPLWEIYKDGADLSNVQWTAH